jgi:hypothetical protein
MTWRRKVPELAVAATVITVYLWACCSVVVREGLSAGPFNMSAFDGFYCVLIGWLDYPFGWLANPLLWAGVVLLACRQSGAAAICGLLAIVPAVQWSLEWDRQGLSRMLGAGYTTCGWPASGCWSRVVWPFGRLARLGSDNTAFGRLLVRQWRGD